ncbi:MAG: hypothetical protein ONB52_21905 [candidate division KSB1 bacterium]|nr:hypothetical protein [candidate division KSB1 bacterium]
MAAGKLQFTLVLVGVAVLAFWFGSCWQRRYEFPTQLPSDRLDSLLRVAGEIQELSQPVIQRLAELGALQRRVWSRDSALAARVAEVKPSIEDCEGDFETLRVLFEQRLAIRDTLLALQAERLAELVGLLEKQRSLVSSQAATLGLQREEIEYWKRRANPPLLKRAGSLLPGIAVGLLIGLLAR